MGSPHIFNPARRVSGTPLISSALPFAQMKQEEKDNKTYLNGVVMNDVLYPDDKCRKRCSPEQLEAFKTLLESPLCTVKLIDDVRTPIQIQKKNVDITEFLACNLERIQVRRDRPVLAFLYGDDYERIRMCLPYIRKKDNVYERNPIESRSAFLSHRLGMPVCVELLQSGRKKVWAMQVVTSLFKACEKEKIISACLTVLPGPFLSLCTDESKGIFQFRIKQ